MPYFKYFDLISLSGHFLYLHNGVKSKKNVINQIKIENDETKYILLS